MEGGNNQIKRAVVSGQHLRQLRVGCAHLLKGIWARHQWLYYRRKKKLFVEELEKIVVKIPLGL